MYTLSAKVGDVGWDIDGSVIYIRYDLLCSLLLFHDNLTTHETHIEQPSLTISSCPPTMMMMLKHYQPWGGLRMLNSPLLTVLLQSFMNFSMRSWEDDFTNVDRKQYTNLKCMLPSGRIVPGLVPIVKEFDGNWDIQWRLLIWEDGR